MLKDIERYCEAFRDIQKHSEAKYMGSKIKSIMLGFPARP